jgi:undecaprenyl-diphosphatase
VNLFQAAVLGITQGVTEFLPISSTAHLRIVPALLGWGDPGAAYTAVLQLGTLVAVISFFLRDLLGMVGALLDPQRRRGPEARMLLYLVAGTIPIGIAGLAFKKAIEGPLRSIAVIGTSLIVVALLMAFVERRARHDRDAEQIRLRDALLIGLAQTLALIPGVSRSGITLVCAMALGLRRDAAARFSFLLSVPAVAAAGLLELPMVLKSPELAGAPLVVGLALSAISGYLSIVWLLRFLRSRTTIPFVIYRVLLGAALLLMVLSGRV